MQVIFLFYYFSNIYRFYQLLCMAYINSRLIQYTRTNADKYICVEIDSARKIFIDTYKKAYLTEKISKTL